MEPVYDTLGGFLSRIHPTCAQHFLVAFRLPGGGEVKLRYETLVPRSFLSRHPPSTTLRSPYRGTGPQRPFSRYCLSAELNRGRVTRRFGTRAGEFLLSVEMRPTFSEWGTTYNRVPSSPPWGLLLAAGAAVEMGEGRDGGRSALASAASRSCVSGDWTLSPAFPCG